MLLRYNAESASPSYDSSWTRSVGLLDPSKDITDDHYIPDLPPPISLPRAKVASIQRRPLSTMFNSRNSLQPHPEYIEHPHELPMNEYNEDFRYNIQLQERFPQQKMTNIQEL